MVTLIPTPTVSGWNQNYTTTSKVAFLELYSDGSISTVSVDIVFTPLEKNSASTTTTTAIQSGTITTTVTSTASAGHPTTITTTVISGTSTIIQVIIVELCSSTTAVYTVTTGDQIHTLTTCYPVEYSYVGTITTTVTTEAPCTTNGVTTVATKVVVYCPESDVTGVTSIGNGSSNGSGNGSGNGNGNGDTIKTVYTSVEISTNKEGQAQTIVHSFEEPITGITETPINPTVDSASGRDSGSDYGHSTSLLSSSSLPEVRSGDSGNKITPSSILLTALLLFFV